MSGNKNTITHTSGASQSGCSLPILLRRLFANHILCSLFVFYCKPRAIKDRESVHQTLTAQIKPGKKTLGNKTLT